MGRRNGSNHGMSVNEFYCTKCGKRGIDVHRKKNQQREAGHLKKLFCFYCNEERNMAEVKPFCSYTYADFLVEFQNGNFDDDGVRKSTYREFLQEMRVKEAKNE